MEDGGREALGFLCRWCLLVLAWAGAGAAAYCGVVAASPHQETPRAVLSDVVCPVALDLAVSGRLVPPPKDGGDIRLLFHFADRFDDTAYEQGEPFFFSLSRAAPGDFRTKLTGVPYVFLMFDGEAGKVRVLAPDDKVCLVDASFAAAAGRRQPAMWNRALEAMRTGRRLAFFHPGPAGPFEAFRRDLRRKGFDEPVLCDFADHDGAIASLRLAYGGLALRGRPVGQDTVVTDDKDVARQAAALGFRSNWIATPGASPAGIDERVKVYAGLESFVRSLEDQAVP